MNTKYLFFRKSKVGIMYQLELIIKILGKELSINYNKISKDFAIIFRFLNYE